MNTGVWRGEYLTMPLPRGGVSSRGARRWIRTFTGRRVEPLALDPRDVDPLDIAHALAQQCRYTGHTRVHYSVAEHCARASALAAAPHKLAALLHDASETYLLDLASPLKGEDEFAGFRACEARIHRAIETRFGLTPGALEHPEVKRVDHLMLCREVPDVMASSLADFALEAPDGLAGVPRIEQPMGPEDAEFDYLEGLLALLRARRG